VVVDRGDGVRIEFRARLGDGEASDFGALVRWRLLLWLATTPRGRLLARTGDGVEREDENGPLLAA